MQQTVGIQDYSRTFIQAGVELLHMSGVIGSGKVSPGIDCVGFGYLDVSVLGNGSAGFIQYQIIFATDSLFVNTVTTTSFVIGPGSYISIQVPVLARYCYVTETPIDGVLTDFPSAEFFGSNVYAPRLYASQFAGPLISQNSSVASGNAMTVVANGTFQGVATLCLVNDFNNKWTGYVEWYNPTIVNWQRMIVLFGADRGQSFVGQINLPASIVRVIMVNNDTIAHNLYLELIA